MRVSGRENDNESRRMLIAATVAALALLAALGSIYWSMNRNKSAAAPLTPETLQETMRRADEQIEEVRNNPAMTEDQKQRVIGTIEAGKARTRAGYERLIRGGSDQNSRRR